MDFFIHTLFNFCLVVNWSQNIPLSLTGHVICERLAPKQGRLAIPIDFIRLHFNPTD